MNIFDKIRSLFGNSKAANPDVASNTEHLSKAVEKLDELRGDNITALPGDNRPTASENVAAAAKDYGLSRFSGETDAMGGAADGYRSSK